MGRSSRQSFHGSASAFPADSSPFSRFCSARNLPRCPFLTLRRPLRSPLVSGQKIIKLEELGARKIALASSSFHFPTAKTPRAQREDAMNTTKEEIEQIAERVVDAMLKVHRTLGPGLLESTYQACLAHELRCRGIEVGCESDQGRHQADGQWVMSRLVALLGALCVLAVSFSLQTNRAGRSWFGPIRGDRRKTLILEDRITVTLERRSHKPILREAAVDRDLTPVPWLGNRSMPFACR